MDLQTFEQLPLMGILRGLQQDMIENFVHVINESGLQTLEITMNTKNAEGLIKLVREKLPEKHIGAGTVLTMDEMKRALDAGASFIVMPNLNVEIVSYCVQRSIPVFPGAFTPNEIFQAWQAGASMVKVFPSKFFGPSYFKEIKGPFNQLKLMACGGVSEENVVDFFSHGADAISFGGSIFDLEKLKSGDVQPMIASIKNLIAGFRQ